jgi:hypothetical protein
MNKSSLTILDDTGGTGQYRFLFAANLLWPIIDKDEEIAVCKHFPSDPSFLASFNTVMIQRWSLPMHRRMFDTTVLPACKAGMANLIYNIDDPVGFDDDGGIPCFNRAHIHYSKPEIQENIKYFLNATDFLLVTTNELKQYYIDKYNVDPSNFIIVPNMLPRSWAYGYFNSIEKVKLFSSRKKQNKIRVGLICSASHFNCHELKWSIEGHDPVNAGKNDKGVYESYMTHKTYKDDEVEIIPDDIDDIIDVIDKTSDRIEWVCCGYGTSPNFKRLVKENKIRVVSQVDIAHYMHHINNLQFDAVIAPVKDTRFNHCKSDIKYLECAAVGALLFAPNCLPYSEHVPEKQLWTSNEDLIDKLLGLYNMPDEDYGAAIETQYMFLNQPMAHPGAPVLRNLWLDDNLDVWRKVLFMPRNGIKIPLKHILATRQKQNEGLPYQNDIDVKFGDDPAHDGTVIDLSNEILEVE